MFQFILVILLILWYNGNVVIMSVSNMAVDGSYPGIGMMCPRERHFIRIASVDSAVK